MASALQSTVELLSNVTDAFTAAVFLFDEDKTELRPAAFHTLSRNLDEEVVIPVGAGIIGYVAKSGQAVNIPNFDRQTESLGIYFDEEEIKSFLAVPIGDEGVLSVDSKQTYLFTDKDQKILEGFAELFLNLIKAERIQAREKSYAKMLSLLHLVDRTCSEACDLDGFNAGVLEVIREFTGTELGFFASLDSTSSRYRVESVVGLTDPNFVGTSYPVATGLAGWIYREKQPLVLRRVRDKEERSYVFSPQDPIRKFKSFIGWPLTSADRRIGVMGVVGFEPKDWTADQMAVLSMTVRWVGATIGSWADKEGD